MSDLATTTAFALLQASPVGNAMWNIGCGLFAAGLQATGKGAWSRVNGWWKDSSNQQSLDVLKATHAAYVASMGKMAAAANAIAFDNDEVAAAKALAAKIAQPAFKDFRWDGEHLPLELCQARIESLFAGQSMPGSTDDSWQAFNRTVVDDLDAWGVPLPPRLAALFISGDGGYEPWHLCFRSEFAKQIRNDDQRPEGERAFRMLSFERLNELTASGAVLTDAVADMHRVLIAVDRKVTQLLADFGHFSGDIRTLIDSVPDLALRQSIAALVNSDPAASAIEIAGDVERFARDYRALKAQVSAIETTDNHVAALKESATQALDYGDLVGAQRLFAEAKSVRRERAKREAIEAAEFAKAEGDTAMLQRDSRAADVAWREAEELIAPFDRDAAESLCRDVAERLFVFGSRMGGLSSLWASQQRWETLARAALQRGDYKRVATINISLGNTLSELGQRSGGKAGLMLLSDAAAAFRTSLATHTREAEPVNWAMIQTNLGIVLKAQGERSGGEAGLTLLAEAIDAQHRALEVRKRENAPLDWAATKINLGSALRVLGERSAGDLADELLTKAVVAFREALAVYTRDEVPEYWATTQNNLGNALMSQAQRLDGAAGLELLAEAIVTFRATLEVHTREVAPAAWAMTQNNIGLALKLYAERHDGPAKSVPLIEAVTAFRAALAVYTRDAMPADWALTQINLGEALRSLSQLSERTVALVLLAEAVTGYRAVMEMHTLDTAPAFWATTQNNLGIALAVRADRCTGAEKFTSLADAAVSLRAALNVRTLHVEPVDWAMTQFNLAIVELNRSTISDVSSALKFAQSARSACEAALNVYTSENMPVHNSDARELLRRIEKRLTELNS